MSITKTSFGRLPDGRAADLYILKNTSGASVEISNYGGILAALHVPDKNGALGNVLLGYSDVSGYVPHSGYMGALLGRVGNRIANGECVVSGRELHLAKNEKGINHLHGGIEGFDKKFWDATPLEGICEDSLILRYVSPDGEEGYPGTLRVMVTYTFTDENELIIHYEAVCDADTLCNLSNHAYFNLEGEGSGSALDHLFEINADTMTVADAHLIPTGELAEVAGTPFDFHEPKAMGEAIAQTESNEQLRFAGGIDHNFNINDPEIGLRYAATVTAPVSGRVMDVFTDMPAVQFYSCCNLHGVNPARCGRLYQPFEGFCLETQYAPDSIHHPNFPDSVLRAGEKYDFTTIYAFGVAEEE